MTSSFVCVCCGGTDSRLLEDVPYARIWAALLDETGATFPDDVIRANSVGTTVPLRRCLACGLEQFPPEAAGDERFYEHLVAPGALPYEEGKWEFEHVLERLVPSDRLVDLGCGDGRFLAKASRIAETAIGVDLNRQAVETVQQRGLKALHVTAFADFATGHTGEFDVVTGFQVLEHVPDVTRFVSAAMSCLRPAGRLFLSVPNPNRVLRQGFQVLDNPPHHVTRWREPQLRVLAARMALEVVDVAAEPAFAPEYVARRLRAVTRRAVPAPVVAVVRAARLIPVATKEMVRQRRVVPRLQGHALIIELRRPD